MKQHTLFIFKQKFFFRLAWVLVIILAITAGYLSEQLKNQTKVYLKLEDRYVRVREQLGSEELERLIDLSYQE